MDRHDVKPVKQKRKHLKCLIPPRGTKRPKVKIYQSAIQKGFEEDIDSAHPETSVFGCALSAISFRLSAKDIKNNVLADCCSLTAESSIQKLVVSGWTLNNKYL
jgi:hypothetical protein